MPQRPCLGHNGPCPTHALTRNPTARCDTCRTNADKARGTTTQRGYGTQHQQLRATWEPTVKAGNAVCPKCHQPIKPTDTWDMGHNADRTGYIGPEHAKCNRATRSRAF